MTLVRYVIQAVTTLRYWRHHIPIGRHSMAGRYAYLNSGTASSNRYSLGSLVPRKEPQISRDMGAEGAHMTKGPISLLHRVTPRIFFLRYTSIASSQTLFNVEKWVWPGDEGNTSTYYPAPYAARAPPRGVWLGRDIHSEHSTFSAAHRENLKLDSQ